MPTKVGITFSWRIRPVSDRLIASQNVAQERQLVVEPCGMPVWR